MQECKINFYCLRHLVRLMRGRHSSTSFKRTLVSNMKKKITTKSEFPCVGLSTPSLATLNICAICSSCKFSGKILFS